MAFEDFLPSIFRPRRRKLYEDGDPGTGFDYSVPYPEYNRRQPWDERLPNGTPAMDAARGGRDMMFHYGRDDQNLPPSNYALAQQPQQKINPPLPPAEPTQDDGTDYRTNYGLPPNREPHLQEAPPPPTMTRADKSGRPQETIGGTSAERIMAQRGAIEAYDPEAHKPKGWWDRFLKPALKKAGIGFIYGGLGGALGGGAEGLIEGGFAPGRANRLWKERQLARSDQQIKNVYDQTKEQAQIENQQSTTELNRARAEQLRRPKTGAKHYIERSDGVYEVSKDNPDGRKIANVPAEARTRNPNPTRYFEREDGVYGINDEHPEGFKVSGVPGKPKTDTGQAELTNQMIDQNIAEADAEQQKLGPAPEIYVNTIDPITGESKRTVNPAYTNWENRYQKLDDDKRRWREQKKAVPKTRSTPTKGGQRYKVDPKFLQ